MDSRLLNVFHDDPFDGNYVKYDTDTQFWSSESETLGLQLTETLHGILPITPTEVVSTNIYGGSLLKDEDYSLESKHDSNTNSIIYGDYEDAAQLGMTNKRQLSTQQAIEIVSVHPNDDDYDSEFSESTEDEDGDGDDEDAMHIEHFRSLPGVVKFNDARSCSRSTFRSRTDSSSIGDYESHSSDYDDDSDDDDIMQFNSSENDLRLQAAEIGDDITLHSDANELKKTMEDVDAFGIQLDANTFDLAAFITQDDQFDCHQSQASVIAQPPRVDLGQVNLPAKSSESDSDSDVIVDVETVENDDAELWDQQNEQPLEYVDNVKSDPSWSPNNLKSEKKEGKPIEPNFKSNFTVIPSKRQSDFLKRKFGLGRGKNISMHRNPSKTPTKSDTKCKSQSTNNNNVELKTKNPTIQPRIADKKVENLILKPEKKIEITTPVKKMENIPAIKHDIPPVKIKVEKPTPELKQPPPVIVKVEKSPAAFQTPPSSNGKCMKLLKHDTVSIKTEPEEVPTLDEPVNEVEVVTQNRQMFPQKRKLNIEEYKKRRENPSAFPPSSKYIQTVDIAKIRKTEDSVQTIIKPIPTKPLTNKPQQTTAAVTSIVKSLKESQGTKRFIDPITEAKNKVLRMQELKKAQQIKIIDSTVSSKVGRVTRLPPLKDIVKDTYRSGNGDEEGGPAMTNPDYEEIINVSTGCNTDITIPPGGYNSVLPKVGKNASRSLLKSSVLLANISNSFEKVRCDDTVKISSNSLLVSIQDVVVKNSAPFPTEPIKTTQGTSTTSDHGEDKVIMHLRKDRIRKRKFTQSTQTELLPEFPTLPPPVVESSSCDSSSRDRSRKGRRRQYRARQHSYSSGNESRERSRSSSRSVGKRSRRHRSSISSSYSESDEYPKRTHRFSGSSSHSRDRSRSSSAGRRSRSRSFDRVYRNSRSRSRSKSRSTRGGTVDTNRHVDRNVSAPAVEERRIVYVGRIEQETTKEMLRRKFVAYGQIKQITIHYKDTGMKYGFVTYEKSEDAFRVIDSGQKDATINMYDISFGGRRAFCRASYADLDNAGINTYQSYVVPRPVAPPKEEDSFEALLLKVKAKLNATKSSSSSSKI